MYSRDRLIKAIDNSACLTRRQIDDYLQKKLFPEELYVVEMHLNECPFCNDAIEGFAKIPDANTFLSKAENFVFPATGAGDAGKSKPVNKSQAAPAQQTPSRPKDPVPSATKSNAATSSEATSNPFKGEKRPGRSGIQIGIAAGLALALGIWGVSSLMKDDGPADKVLAEAQQAGEDQQDEMFNASSVNRKEDSVMNAKYGFQNQTPLAASAKGREYIRSGDTAMVEEDRSGVSMADQMTAAAAPSATVAAEKPSGFIGPVMPKDDAAKKSASGTSNTEKAKAPTVASSTKRSASTADATKARSSAATGSKEVAKPEPTPAVTRKEAKEASKKEAEKTVNPAVTQAEKDFAKGLDLYNKKQYSASIMYFQSASKVKDFPKRKQAESYIKLAKSEVVNAERRKNSETNK